MLKVLSVGEGLRDGAMQDIFSSHCKAVNFIQQQQVLTVCCRELCPGYYRVVLDAPDVSFVQSLRYAGGQVLINNQPCQMGEAKRYRVPDFKAELSVHQICHRLSECFHIFRSSSPEISVNSLTLSDQSAGFAHALSTSYRDGLQYFKQGNYSSAVKCFKGRGFGLTPGGDDFLAGYIMGLAFKQRVQKKDLSEILDLLVYESLSENCLTNTFILQARALHPDLDWADFLQSLGSKNMNPQEPMSRIFRHGASSGYDTLSGFFAAWEII